MSNEWLNNVLSVCEKKEGGVYLRFTQDEAVFNAFVERLAANGAGSSVNLTDKEADLDKQLADGKITEEKHVELKEKFGFIIFEGTLPPA